MGTVGIGEELLPPGNLERLETAQPGMNEQAGFCVLVAEKKENT